MQAFEIASHSEQLIWQTIQQNKRCPSSTLSYRFKLNKILSFDAVQQAMVRLLANHCTSLNYRFFERNTILYKQFFDASETPVKHITNRKKIKKILFTDELIPLYQFEWYKTPTGGTLIIHLSHLVFDGACYQDFCKAITMAFENSKTDVNPPPKDATIKGNNNAADFWQQELNGKNLYQSIPFLDQTNHKEFVSASHSLSNILYKKLNKFNIEQDVTLFQTITSAFSILLHHYLRDDETYSSITLSYCVSTRKKSEAIGCYFNLLPLFIECDSNATALSILNSIKQTRKKQKPHQHIIVNQLTSFIDEKINRHNPLFNIVINHSPGLLPLNGPVIDALTTHVSGIDNRSAEKQLSLIYNFDDEKLAFRIESNAGLLFDELLQQLLINLEKTLDFIVHDATQLIGELNFNRDRTPLSIGRTLPKKSEPLINYFLMKAEHYYDKIAIRSNDDALSYQTIIDSIHQLSMAIHQLDKSCLDNGIGIYLPHTSYLPIALLACIAQRIPFIPLSIELPLDTINQLINETRIGAIFVNEKSLCALSLKNPSTQLINIDQVLKGKPQQIKCSPKYSEDIAYTLFTSGSTGKPKGVMVTYDNLFNFLRSMAANPGLTEHDTVLAMTAISFDIAINELLLPLFCGATVFIVDEITRKDSRRLIEIIDEHEITTIQTTPSTMQLLKQTSWQSRRGEIRFWVGGEALPRSLAQYFIEQKHHVFNMYGPTEATIWAATARVENDKPITIGCAVDNTMLFVLNHEGKTPSLGVAGELVISGAQVAKGYSNHPSTPFIENTDGDKCYYTGDKVIALAQDNIIFLKRVDEQVKVRGHRVELAEINQRIIALQTGIDVVTVLREKPEPHLYAFYTHSNGALIIADKILAQLKQFLPDYKIPQALVFLPSFPLTNNGKIDKKALTNMEPSTIVSYLYQHTKSMDKISSATLKGINALKVLIKTNFNIDVHENNTPLTYYGFNSLSFNLLSTILEENFNVLIRAHEFYRWSDLASIAKRCQSTHSTSLHLPNHKPSPRPSQTRIAIIGYDALLPCGMDAEGFWQALLSKKTMITSHHREWLKKDEKAGFIDQIDVFDRRFFNMSPLEVLRMDPRQRMLLQCAYKTLEHAGYAADSLKGDKVGCFVAGTGSDYLLAQEKQDLKIHPYTLSGNASSMLANRISYYFDWKGPSMTIDTACSGALAALIRAVENITLGNTSMCFVAAANIIADNHLSDALNAGNFLSPTAHCASFSDKADGYVRGEGVIGFLLKSYDKAIEDGDFIHAIIESVAENHGGRAQSLTAPNQDAQTALLLDAYTTTLSKQLSYLETHGTGTQLGDPIEIDALKAFEQQALVNTDQDVIYLGTVKPIIGHLESAAGFASILKVILAMKHQMLPANLQKDPLNTLISLANSKLTLIKENKAWNTKTNVVAGVSAFGFGGANAHVVLSSYKSPDLNNKKNNEEALLFVLSAKSQNALLARIQALIGDIKNQSSPISLKNVSYTLATGREIMSYRIAFIATNEKSLLALLHNSLKKLELAAPNTASTKLQPYVDAYLRAESINWNELFEKRTHRRLALTPYSFERESFWFTSLLQQEKPSISLLDVLDIEHISQNKVHVNIPAKHPFLSEHQVYGQKVLPGVVHIELALWLLKHKGLLEYPISVENFYWLRPVICDTEGIHLIITVHATDEGFQVELTDKQNIIYSRGNFHRKTLRVLSEHWLVDIQTSLRTSSITHYNAKQIYKTFSMLGINYGNYFQGIERVEVHENMACAYLSIESSGSLAGLLDAALQSGMAVSLNNNQPGLMPFTLGAMTLLSETALLQLKTARVYTQKLSLFRTHLMICNSDDIPLLTVVDLGVKPSLINKVVTHD